MNRDLERLKKNSAKKLSFAQEAMQEKKIVENHIEQVNDEYKRAVTVSMQAPAIIRNIDKEFKQKTKLCETDIVFLLLATAIQCARQYLLSNEKFRLTSKQNDKLMEKILAPAPPSWQEVLLQSVPYDAITRGVHVHESTGLSGTTHRYRTLGHDPVLGWVFGTANIMTRSLTKTDFESFMVKDNVIIKHYPNGVSGIFDKAVSYAQKDKYLLPASIARQAVHFGSDYFSKQGLPVPLISTINNDLAKNMILNGSIDSFSIMRSAGLAALINKLVAIIHNLFYNENTDGPKNMYEVRTRKILSYSNALSVGSNVVVTAVTKDLKKLDVGGAVVAFHRFISDYNFIQKIKTEFLEKEIYNMIIGTQYDFMDGV